MFGLRLDFGDSCSALPPRSSPWQPSLAPPATAAFPPHGSLFTTGRMSNCVPRSAARRSSRAVAPPAISSCTRHRSKVRWARSTDPPSQMCPGQSVPKPAVRRELLRGQRAGLWAPGCETEVRSLKGGSKEPSGATSVPQSLTAALLRWLFADSRSRDVGWGDSPGSPLLQHRPSPVCDPGQPRRPVQASVNPCGKLWMVGLRGPFWLQLC